MRVAMNEVAIAYFLNFEMGNLHEIVGSFPAAQIIKIYLFRIHLEQFRVQAAKIRQPSVF